MTRLYNSGLPFHTKLAENLDDCMDRITNNKASMIIIDGGIGEGKTTLSVHIADYINKAPIDFQHQLSMGGADFQEKLRKCYVRKLPVCIYDEAGDYSKRGSLTRFNAMINRTFETFRAFKIIVILCLPCFDVLDNSIFDKNIPRLLLNCHGRNDKYGNFKGYSLYRMLYLKSNMKKAVVKGMTYGIVHPNFQGSFLDLSESRSKELDEISTREKFKIMEKSEANLQGLYSYEDVAEKLVRSIIWVRKSVAELGINPTKTINNRKYFDNVDIEKLKEKISASKVGDKGERR